MTTKFQSPTGRLLWGHPLKRGQIQKDDNGQVRLDKNGQPLQPWSFGVAFNKAEFTNVIWPAMCAEAGLGFPNGVPKDFAWKYVDGDSIDADGVPYSSKEGYAGCYVLAFTSYSFAPPVYKFIAQTGQYEQVDEHGVKCGDYVIVSGSFAINIASDKKKKSGLYVNPDGVILVGYGPEITRRASPQEMFKDVNLALPPGASATPIANTSVLPPAMQQAPMQQQQYPQQQAAMPGQMPVQQYQQAPMGNAPVQNAALQYPQAGTMPGVNPAIQYPSNQPAQLPPPAHDFVQNAGMLPQTHQMSMQQAPMQQQQYPQQQAAMPGQMPGMPIR